MDIAIGAQRLRYLLREGAVRSPAGGYAGFALLRRRGGSVQRPGPGPLVGHLGGGRATPSPPRSRSSAALAALAALAADAAGRRQRCAAPSRWPGRWSAPLVWLATREPVTPDALVVARSGVLLLHHGTPYLQSAPACPRRLARLQPLPSGDGGLRPAKVGLTRPPRGSAAVARGGHVPFPVRRFPYQPDPPDRGTPVAAFGLTALAISSPVMAFPLAEGIAAPPVIALTCLALALLIRFGGVALTAGRGPRGG